MTSAQKMSPACRPPSFKIASIRASASAVQDGRPFEKVTRAGKLSTRLAFARRPNYASGYACSKRRARPLEAEAHRREGGEVVEVVVGNVGAPGRIDETEAKLPVSRRRPAPVDAQIVVFVLALRTEADRYTRLAAVVPDYVLVVGLEAGALGDEPIWCNPNRAGEDVVRGHVLDAADLPQQPSGDAGLAGPTPVRPDIAGGSGKVALREVGKLALGVREPAGHVGIAAEPAPGEVNAGVVLFVTGVADDRRLGAVRVVAVGVTRPEDHPVPLGGDVLEAEPERVLGQVGRRDDRVAVVDRRVRIAAGQPPAGMQPVLGVRAADLHGAQVLNQRAQVGEPAQELQAVVAEVPVPAVADLPQPGAAEVDAFPVEVGVAFVPIRVPLDVGADGLPPRGEIGRRPHEPVADPGSAWTVADAGLGRADVARETQEVVVVGEPATHVEPEWLTFQRLSSAGADQRNRQRGEPRPR